MLACILPAMDSALAQSPPARPTPLEFDAPEVSRQITPEMEEKYRQNPALEEELWKQDRALKSKVATYDAATKAYSAHSTREKMKSRSAQMAERFRNSGQAISLKLATDQETETSRRNPMKTAMGIGGLILLIAAGILIWAYGFKSKKQEA